MDRQIAPVAEDDGVTVLAFSVIAHSTCRVLSRKVHIGFRHAFHLAGVLLMGQATRQRGTTYQEEPFLLQLVEDNFKYL